MIIDSSVLVAFYNEKDVHHEKAVEIIKTLDKETSFISDYIINETISVALRKIGLKKAKGIAEFLMNKRNLIVTYTMQEDFKEIIEIFKNQNDNLSFVDCHLMWMTKTLGLEVASFDKNLLTKVKANK